MTQTTEQAEQAEHDDRTIALCHRIMRLAGTVAVAAFVAIILATTLSTGGWARLAGQLLYYVILASIVVSLVAWIWRVKLEKRNR